MAPIIRDELANAVHDLAHWSYLIPVRGPTPDVLTVMRGACIEAGIYSGKDSACERVDADDLDRARAVRDADINDLLRACCNAQATWEDFLNEPDEQTGT